MRFGTLVLGCAALVIACGDDGVGATNDESSTGNPETTDPDDEGPDDGPDDGPEDDGPDPDSSTSSSGPDPTTTSSSTASESSSSETGAPESSSSGSDSSSSSDGGSTTSGESSTTDVNNEESSSDDEDSVGFIEPPPGECDPYLQDCPPGEKCNAWANDGGTSWNSLACFPIDAMPDAVGDPCTVEGSGVSGVDSCDIGAMCWDVDTDTNMGTCIALCIGSADDPSCADAASNCIIANEGSLNICLPFCDPLMQDCGVGQGCYAIGAGFACAPDASGDDAGVYGDPCEYVNVCDPGLWCGAPDAVSDCGSLTGCCSTFCDASDPLAVCPDAGDGQACVPFFADGTAPPGFEDVGVCMFPV